MMKLIKRFAAVAALTGAGALAAPVWADQTRDQALPCPENGYCWRNQTYGSAFDCVVRRNGKAYLSQDGKPYCADLPGLPHLAEVGAEACWLDHDNRGAGAACFLPASGTGAFVDADDNCSGGKGGGADGFIHVRPVESGQDGADPTNCVPASDAVALGGDSRPDPMALHPHACPKNERLVVRYYRGSPIGFCEPAKKGEMRVNGLPMGLMVWHPSPNLNHMFEAERHCWSGTIPVRAKAVGDQRRNPHRCACPEPTHKWVGLAAGSRYCFATHEGKNATLDSMIEGWSEWEREMEELKSAAGN